MPLVDMREMVQHAYDNGYAIGGFDVIDLDFLGAVIAAAERCESPIILSLAESHFKYYDFETLMPAVEDAARRCAVPAAIHLDHGSGVDMAVKAINLGCNGVMIDASHESFDDNVRLTHEIVATARGCHIPVEGELGYVAGVEGEDAELHGGELRYTSVDEASEFVERTGVDMLAVSIGTVHGRMRGEPELDYDLLARINDALGIPLVIHGGTGLSDAQFRKLIDNGVAKINYYTALSDAAAAQVLKNTDNPPSGITGLHAGIRDAIAAECERCMRLWGSAGQAGAVLEQATPWKPVEHVIVFQVDAATPEEAVLEMMRHGRDVLARIPGVREVFIGSAVKSDAAYRYCWVVRFAHPDVIDSYRDHPLHQQFADEHFRPLAAERITTDYAEI